MEQYRIAEELKFENLRKCIDNYTADRITIRDLGGINEDGNYRVQGIQKLNRRLIGKKLDFKKQDLDLYMLIDSEEVFHFNLDTFSTGFFIAYERFDSKKNDYERLIVLSHGIDPYDPELPEPRMSFLRTILDSHEMEIFFKGRIELEFHSWWKKPEWKYWAVKTEKYS